MNKEQITANFKAAHTKAVVNVANAQHAVMEAQAGLAAARKTQQALEKQYRLDMAEATTDVQGELPLNDAKKK